MSPCGEPKPPTMLNPGASDDNVFTVVAFFNTSSSSAAPIEVFAVLCTPTWPEPPKKSERKKASTVNTLSSEKNAEFLFDPWAKLTTLLPVLPMLVGLIQLLLIVQLLLKSLWKTNGVLVLFFITSTSLL